ncbi:hypothetical protein Taro_005930 [Colocasia esculenta]|uniref:Macro domain-containing protein n=1 Tax=Colocasia esculenta TaxID=4460 RepID=A0A843TR84_COLES|nr:hypothetical protein [Colocasia esculenta]
MAKSDPDSDPAFLPLSEIAITHQKLLPAMAKCVLSHSGVQVWVSTRAALVAVMETQVEAHLWLRENEAVKNQMGMASHTRKGRVIHTVGPKYAVKYHTAAENALSHCYRSCLELLIENGLQSIATGCIYTEAKNYPREPAAHVAIIKQSNVIFGSCALIEFLQRNLSGTVRRFLEKQKDKITAVVFCTTTSSDTEIYKRLLPLYFPRDKHEEEIAMLKLPADVGDENGEIIIDERKIRIRPLPVIPATIEKSPTTQVDLPVSDVGLTMRRNSFHLDSYLDPAFMSLIKDPDQRRQEQWEKSAQARSGFNCAKLLGFGDLGGPPLTAAEEYSLHSRYLAKANSLNLSEIAEMKIVVGVFHHCDTSIFPFSHWKASRKESKDEQSLEKSPFV